MSDSKKKNLALKAWEKLIVRYLAMIVFTILIIVLLMSEGENKVYDPEDESILVNIIVALIMTAAGEIILLIRVIVLRFMYPNKLLIAQRKHLIFETFKQYTTSANSGQVKHYPEGKKHPQLVPVLDKRELVYGHIETAQILYCFTPLALIYFDKPKLIKINIEDIVEIEENTNSNQQEVKIKTFQGQVHIIDVEGLSPRLRKLFYSLVVQTYTEEDSVVFTQSEQMLSESIKTYQFTGPLKLLKVSEEIPPAELPQLGFTFHESDVYRNIKLSTKANQLQYYGEYDEQEEIIYPDEQGLLILQLVQNTGVLELFNSFTDGYNGIKATKKTPQELHFTPLEGISEVILRYGYTIKMNDETILQEMKLDSLEEVTDLFSVIQVDVLANGQPRLLTLFKTQD